MVVVVEEALLRQSQLLALENPSSRVRKAVTRWFAHTDPLVGIARDVFADTRDLVALRTAPDQDRLSLFLQDHLGYLFRVGCPFLCSFISAISSLPEDSFHHYPSLQRHVERV